MCVKNINSEERFVYARNVCLSMLILLRRARGNKVIVVEAETVYFGLQRRSWRYRRRTVESERIAGTVVKLKMRMLCACRDPKEDQPTPSAALVRGYTMSVYVLVR